MIGQKMSEAALRDFSVFKSELLEAQHALSRQPDDAQIIKEEDHHTYAGEALDKYYDGLWKNAVLQPVQQLRLN